MKNKELNICLVSLAREIEIIQKNIHNFEKIYNSYNLNFFIICTSRDKKIFEFTKSVEMVYDVLKNDLLDAVYIAGDRLEPYAVALAARIVQEQFQPFINFDEPK